MEGCILSRLESGDQGLLLKLFTSDGDLQSIKIPGILKSKKRSSFFMTPAAFWKFTFSGSQKDIMIPREHELLFCPFDFNVTWKMLEKIKSLLEPLKFLRKEIQQPETYHLLRAILESWSKNPDHVHNHQINQFYLHFLQALGLFHLSDCCIQCGKKITENDFYHLDKGNFCQSCDTLMNGLSKTSQAMKLPSDWVLIYYQSEYLHGTITSASSDNSTNFRQIILSFLDHSYPSTVQRPTH